MTPFDRIEALLKPLPRKFIVRFALHCCMDIKDLVTRPDSTEALRAVEAWLGGKTDEKEVKAAAKNVYKTSQAATKVEYSASNAAVYTARSAQSEVPYVEATFAASNAAYTVGSGVVYYKKMLQYETDLKNMIQSLTKLEKVVYDIK